MTKDVIVTMKGIQLAQEDDGAGAIEIVSAGNYYCKDGLSYLFYEEPADEDSDTMVKTKLIFRPHYLEVTKKGPINVHMVFEEGREDLTEYRTPMGMMMVGITTDQVLIRETEEEILINASYSLAVNYEHLSDCTISIRVTPDGTGKAQ